MLFEKAVSSVPSDKARLVMPLWIVFCITHVHVLKNNNLLPGHTLIALILTISLSLSLALSCSEIWEKFVEFESSVGDLVSLIKVERRRAATVKNEVLMNTRSSPFP